MKKQNNNYYGNNKSLSKELSLNFCSGIKQIE